MPIKYNPSPKMSVDDYVRGRIEELVQQPTRTQQQEEELQQYYQLLQRFENNRAARQEEDERMQEDNEKEQLQEPIPSNEQVALRRRYRRR
jgi:hypothetical protein